MIFTVSEIDEIFIFFDQTGSQQTLSACCGMGGRYNFGLGMMCGTGQSTVCPFSVPTLGWNPSDSRVLQGNCQQAHCRWCLLINKTNRMDFYIFFAFLLEKLSN